MPNQPGLFDGDLSDSLRSEGMQRAANNRSEHLELAREIAKELAREFGEVHADLVGRELWIRHGIRTLGPAAGSIFKSREWVWTGEWVKSVRATNHSRMLRVWRHA